MSQLTIFMWGFGGSLAVEVISLYQVLSHDHAELPPRYKKIGFWVCRILVAFVGGGLTIAYNIHDNPLLAANIGAATPMIIKGLASGLSLPQS